MTETLRPDGLADPRQARLKSGDRGLVSSIPSPWTRPLPRNAFDAAAIALLCAVAIIALLTFRDYGLSWDDYTHSEYGDLLLELYASRFSDRRALSFVNLYYYGGGFDLLAALVAKVLPFTLFDTRRLMGAAVGILGLLVTWRMGRRIGGPPAGLVALVLLAACPLYYGHMFMNPKDSPFAVATAIFLLGMVRALEGYPNISIATKALVGIGFGLSFGSRIMGAFGAIAAIGAIALILAVEARANGLRMAATRLGHFILALVPAMLLAYAVMALVWPWSVIDPLNPFRAVEYFSHFFEKPWEELFGGTLISVPDMPRSYVPTLFVLKLPEIFVALGFGGAAGALVATARHDVTPNRRAIFLLLALAGLLPVAVTIALRPAMYNGIRHFIFVLPPLAVLGGLAAVWLFNATRLIAATNRLRLAPIVAAAIFVAGVALPVVEMVRLHPFEYTHFNRLMGGVGRAQGRYMLDYWALAFRQASQGLLAKLAESGETKPGGGPWKLAVCGPHRSPQVELGPDFQTTWDPQGADFAMMLGVFYCAKFDAPLLVDVVREGVSYARVYDIRGRSFRTLLTRPSL
jgi:dolichyl-phosphate-mannose-protein mannosyltransferase